MREISFIRGTIMKNLTSKTALHFWIYLIVLLATFANVAKSQELNIALRTTKDVSFEDSRFMAVGWAPESFWVPAPPAPPGDAFYMYTARTYRFKDIKKYQAEQVYEWTFDFYLPYSSDSQELFIDTEKIRSQAEYAVVLDTDNHILFNLSEDSVITLTHELNGRFKIRMLPAGNSSAPISLEETAIVEVIDDNKESLSIDLTHLFINPNSSSTSYAINGIDNSVQYELNNGVLTIDLNSVHSNELAINIIAQNVFGSAATEIILKNAVTTSVEDDLNPNQISLAQNYPNPFNPTTTISYSLPQTSNVSLNVYNMNGQVVARLVDGAQVSGSHSVQFDAQNLPSGIYIYRLISEGNVITKKMTLIK